jgi:hypothetical protein
VPDLTGSAEIVQGDGVSTSYPGSSPYAVQPPLPVKRRPRAWWFALGIVLMLASAVVFGLSVARFVHSVAHTDAEFQSIGRHHVSVPAHVRRGLFRSETDPRPLCRAEDGTGARIRFEHVQDHFTLNGWIAVDTFDTGDGQLTFTCGQGPTLVSDVRIGEVPTGGDFARLGLVGIVLPLVLGLVGFLVLLITTILWFTRKPPRPGPPYAAGPFAPGRPGTPPQG